MNAVERLVSRYGRLPDEHELNALRKRDVAALLPTAQFRAQRELEPPDPDEGYSRIKVVPFERRINPAHVNRAVIVWCDDVLLRSRSGQRSPDQRRRRPHRQGARGGPAALSSRGLASAWLVVATRGGRRVANRRPTSTPCSRE